MTAQEHKRFVSLLNQYKRKVTKDKSFARSFLIDLGVVTEKGNLRKPYKNLCIPEEQA